MLDQLLRRLRPRVSAYFPALHLGTDKLGGTFLLQWNQYCERDRVVLDVSMLDDWRAYGLTDREGFGSAEQYAYEWEAPETGV